LELLWSLSIVGRNCTNCPDFILNGKSYWQSQYLFYSNSLLKSYRDQSTSNRIQSSFGCEQIVLRSSIPGILNIDPDS